MGLREFFQRHYASQEEQLRQRSDEELVGEMTKYNRETGACIAGCSVGLGGLLAAAVLSSSPEIFLAAQGAYWATEIPLITYGNVLAGKKEIIREIAEERGFTTVRKGFAFDRIER